MNHIQQTELIVANRQESPFFKIIRTKQNLKKGTAITQNICFSVDPVMRVWLSGAPTNFRQVQIGATMNCFGLGRVLQGNEDFPEGQYVFGNLGTSSFTVFDSRRERECFAVPSSIVHMYGPFHFLYYINNGLAAFAGLEILSPSKGETVIVSTAAGATGLIMCLLLRERGCRVIGLTSEHKVPFLTTYVDKAVNYQNPHQLRSTLKNLQFKHYFDNVGQTLLDNILLHIQPQGKIALCGAIANYSNFQNKGITNVEQIILKKVTITGLTFTTMLPRAQQIFPYFKSFHLPMKIITLDQFEGNFREMLKSGSSTMGKIIVKLCEQ